MKAGKRLRQAGGRLASEGEALRKEGERLAQAGEPVVNVLACLLPGAAGRAQEILLAGATAARYCAARSGAYLFLAGQEPWLNYIMSVKYTEQSNPLIASNKLVEDCLAHGVQAERLFGEKEILLA